MSLILRMLNAISSAVSRGEPRRPAEVRPIQEPGLTWCSKCKAYLPRVHWEGARTVKGSDERLKVHR